MKFTYIALSLVFGAQVLARPARVILQGENGIIVEDDGSTKIDGETGITKNAQGQTTNIGGSAGITIGGEASEKAEGSQPAEEMAKAGGNGTAIGEAARAKEEGATATPTEGATQLTEAGAAAPKASSAGGTQGLVDLISALQGVSRGTAKAPAAGEEPTAVEGSEGAAPTIVEETAPAAGGTIDLAEGATEAVKPAVEPAVEGSVDGGAEVQKEVSKSE